MSDKAQKIDVEQLNEQLQKPLPEKVKKSIEQHIKNADKDIKK